ncbi:HXXEE domain-containing protein [Vallitalea okinawensis]|uniref:HXXEE domain-containing protein n=1 Tax=Vallitalea okinawensis TaxID=2078660 RepID=UPI0013001714|nr:HXXEE domain-containing protein [Vallitalea okinawensis]
MWKQVYKTLHYHRLIIITLVTYLTIHLIEEALLGFPAWALTRWGIPGYTTFKWLIHNVYFAGFLIIGYFIYRINKEKYLVFGLGIVVWGLLNALNHIIFTVIFLEYSPGLLTGLLFLAYTIMTIFKLKEQDKLSFKIISLSIFIGVIYWVLPIVSFIEIDKLMGL